MKSIYNNKSYRYMLVASINYSKRSHSTAIGDAIVTNNKCIELERKALLVLYKVIIDATPYDSPFSF